MEKFTEVHFLILMLLAICIHYCLVLPEKGKLKIILSFKKVRFVTKSIGVRIPVLEKVHEISYRDLTLEKNYAISTNDDYIGEIKLICIIKIMKDIQSCIQLCNHFADFDEEQVKQYLFKHLIDKSIVTHFNSVSNNEFSSYISDKVEKEITKAISEKILEFGYEVDCINIEIVRNLETNSKKKLKY